jgi:hypothetical protein
VTTVTDLDPTPRSDLAAIDAERSRWYELDGLVRQLSEGECLEPGYYRDPDWSVRDLMAHVGTWLAEAEVQLQRIGAATYEGHDIDVDALNAVFLEAMRGQSWTVTWLQTQAGRTRMLQEWRAVVAPDDETTWWIRKSGAEHYDEHLGRLREWVDELIGRR